MWHNVPHHHIISGFGIYGAAVVPDSGVGNTWQRLTLVLHEFLSQGVYRFNWTNFQEISRIFQEGFLNKSRTCLHCFGPICNVPNELYLMEHVMMSKNRRTSFFKKQPGTKCYDRIPMRSIITRKFSIITQKFPGGPFKFQEISRISRSCRHPEQWWAKYIRLDLNDWKAATVLHHWYNVDHWLVAQYGGRMTSELSLSCTRRTADRWLLMWVNRPL